MFKNRALSYLSNLFSTSPRERPLSKWPDSKKQLISKMLSTIESEPFIPVINFNQEFSHKQTEFAVGYLYEPLPNINIELLSPNLQLSKKDKSPYFCIKIPLSGMGYVFIIPVSVSPFENVIVVRPNRQYRLPVTVHNGIVQPATFTLHKPPFPDLDSALFQLAIVHQALLL